jgi:galactokinase
MTAQDLAQSTFRTTFAGEPEGVWAAPGRVNLIGEHTDYNAGLVLPIALPQRTYAAVRRRDDGELHLVSAEMEPVDPIKTDTISPGHPASWARYPAGVVWAMTRGGFSVGGLDVAFASDVPVGSGLSSSAAIEGAIAAALSDLNGLGLLGTDEGRASLAALCQWAENEIAQAPTGGMDQAAALRSQAGHALYLDCADSSVTHVPFDLPDAGLALLVVDTRAEHSNSAGEYGPRRADCEQACAQLGLETLRELEISDLATALPRLANERLRKRVRHVVTETERVRLAVQALEAADFPELGHLFVDSHASMRHDYEISCPELDLTVMTALEAGALGARMTGGGFGGSAIALVYADALPNTQQAILQAYAQAGYPAPRFITAQAGPPASRVV